MWKWPRWEMTIVAEVITTFWTLVWQNVCDELCLMIVTCLMKIWKISPDFGLWNYFLFFFCFLLVKKIIFLNA
jgi:hypothetical protein